MKLTKGFITSLPAVLGISLRLSGAAAEAEGNLPTTPPSPALATLRAPSVAGQPITRDLVPETDPTRTRRDGAFAVVWASADRESAPASWPSEVFLGPVGIAVDSHVRPGTVSDANGVLEPGELVVVETTWSQYSNYSVLHVSGTLSDFTGPPGGVYTVHDGSASFTIPGPPVGIYTVHDGSPDFAPSAPAPGSCYDGSPASCYTVSVAAAGPRPRHHWDAVARENVRSVEASWTIHIGDSFSDVPRSHPFYRSVETVLHTGVTSGCSPTAYCPDENVRRDQMALFLARVIAQGGEHIPVNGTVGSSPYNCASGGVSLFRDVAPTDAACKAVHWIAAQKITTGCGRDVFCPSTSVTRSEMAFFLVRALFAPAGGSAVPMTYGPDPVTNLSYSCDSGSPDLHFDDVTADDAFCRHVHYLWARGLASGCSPTNYCPRDGVTRAEMARFLSETFRLFGRGS